MPRAKTEKTNTPRGATQCALCDTVIANKTDMPRHMKLHSPNKAKLMHRCPYPDCTFQNLQKSNVETHIRTHTKAKTECCPDCDFATVDPGSLTRHRKRLHQYLPHPRKSRKKQAQEAAIAGSSKEPTESKPQDFTQPHDQGRTPPPPPPPAQQKQKQPSRKQPTQRRTKIPPSSQSAPIYSDQNDRTRSSYELPKYDPQPPRLTRLPPLSSMGQEFAMHRESPFLSPPPIPARSSSSSTSSATTVFATRSPPYTPRTNMLPPILPPLSPTNVNARRSPTTSQGQLRW